MITDHKRRMADQADRIRRLEDGQRDRLLASRADLTAEQRKWLATQPLAEVKKILSSPLVTEDQVRARPAPSVQAGAMGAYLKGNASAPDARAAQRAAMAEKFGRRAAPTAPYVEGRELVLPILSKAQARAVLERHARDYGSDPTVPSRGALADTVAVIGETLMAAARGGKVRS